MLRGSWPLLIPHCMPRATSGGHGQLSSSLSKRPGPKVWSWAFRSAWTDNCMLRGNACGPSPGGCRHILPPPLFSGMSASLQLKRSACSPNEASKKSGGNSEGAQAGVVLNREDAALKRSMQWLRRSFSRITWITWAARQGKRNEETIWIASGDHLGTASGDIDLWRRLLCLEYHSCYF